jgi:quercetin dioxygenase-like cupin family protein
VKPQRRIITIDKEPGKSTLVADSFSPEVILDPARPGFALQRMWVIDSHPAKIVPETLQLPNILVPPKTGTVLNVFTFPPDSQWSGKVDKAQVEAFYKTVRASEICTSGTIPNHPYSQKSDTVDFCLVTEGEIFLILDTKETLLKAGEIAVIRGGNHAWSNRSHQPAMVAISSHDATQE